VAEAILAGLLVAYGMSGPRALAAVVLYRVATLSVVGTLGGGAWLHLRSAPRPAAAVGAGVSRHGDGVSATQPDHEHRPIGRCG
jgi:hypothetical protein